MRVASTTLLLCLLAATSAAEALRIDKGNPPSQVRLYAGWMDSFYFPTLFAEGVEWHVPVHLSIVHPVVGGLVNRRDDHYLYAGFAARIDVGRRVSIVPSAVAGRYWMRRGYDLGGVLQFKTGVLMECRLRSRVSFGVSFDHISNANIYRFNPGINLFSLNIRISLSRRTGPPLP